MPQNYSNTHMKMIFRSNTHPNCICIQQYQNWTEHEQKYITEPLEIHVIVYKFCPALLLQEMPLLFSCLFVCPVKVIQVRKTYIWLKLHIPDTALSRGMANSTFCLSQHVQLDSSSRHTRKVEEKKNSYFHQFLWAKSVLGVGLSCCLISSLSSYGRLSNGFAKIVNNISSSHCIGLAR